MKKARVVPILLLLVLIVGCATMGGGPPGKTFVDMNPKERSLYFMGTYKAQFQDATSMGALAQQGKLSPGQLDVYRVKRNLLIQAKPLIEAYDAIAAGGGIPGADREQEILNLINQLAAAGS
jgi:hypothetical protein